ncbi:transcriptional regulator, TetR family [Desulfatibacillum alkenivorans DSM 16219]|jgi:AcrR family transcriptional regulator|uniref:Transcriptional regulator, TetR family n=1 Tax=Desulfatibacillum alkenivorans DSM 16219 TaxID=1121393 RepID=A0A1M6NZS0_9BACT|nr:TetR/AcrR family transcriptional regulator [Desulfatibacillum alkenivorans]SHK01154.1 transcriptional regulator, TetR family [Desulfatibacillum alkenivorans DSM 16219]
MPKISFRQQRYNKKQQQILENAAQLFAQKGFGEVSLEEIAAKLQLSKASLYHYIKSKDDILFQLHMQAMTESAEALQKVVDSEVPLLEKLRKAIRTLVFIATRNEVLASYRMESRFLPKKMRPQVVEKRDQILECIQQLIREGQEAGLVHCKDWRISAFAAMGAMNWVPMWYSPSGRLSPEEIADVMEEFIFRGFGFNADTAPE